MKKILHAHPAVAMITLLVLIVCALGTFYFLAIGNVFTQVSRGLLPPPPQSGGSFDLPGASGLDLRGLVNTSTTPTTTSAPH